MFSFQLLKDDNGVMQLNLYDVVTNKLIKTLYFDDGVDKNIGRVHVTCISALDADEGEFFLYQAFSSDFGQMASIFTIN